MQSSLQSSNMASYAIAERSFPLPISEFPDMKDKEEIVVNGTVTTVIEEEEERFEWREVWRVKSRNSKFGLKYDVLCLVDY